MSLCCRPYCNLIINVYLFCCCFFNSNKAVEVDCCLRKYILDKIIKGSPNGLFHIWYIWSDLWWKSGKILKNGFRSLGRGSKMKHFPFKFWHLKCSFLLFTKITIFAKFSKKSCFIILVMSGLCAINSLQ